MPPQTNDNKLPTDPVSIPNKKGKFILIAIFILIIAGTYFLYKYIGTPMFPNPNQESPSTIQERDVMLNWKTYRNEEYGFEFKYPTNLFDEVRETPSFFAYGERGEIDVLIINEKLNLNAEVGPNFPGLLIKDLKSLTVGNLNAYEYDFSDGGLITRTILLGYGEITLKIIFGFSYGADTSPDIKPLVKDDYLVSRILSTFKLK